MIRLGCRELSIMTAKVMIGISILHSSLWAQQMSLGWQDEVRKCAQRQDWNAAMAIVEEQISRNPQDMDVRAWRARVLLWSGKVTDAECEYREILAASPNDADNWIGLSTAYTREGQTERAEEALRHALILDPKRADIHATHGRALQLAKKLEEARQEFQRALDLDPTNQEAKQGLSSLKSNPKHELRLGTNADLFSFVEPNHDAGTTLTSRWTPRLRTTVAGSLYRWAGIDAQKFSASVTGTLPRWGSLEGGGATANDNGVIPRAEAFFNYDQGWKLGSEGWIRGLEGVYGQRWYWYSTARILTINQMTIFYLPRDWTWSLGLTEARSHFSGAGTEWRPSGITKLGFPIVGNDIRRLSGNCFFAVGTENFAQLNQIGRFSSQTYGGGLRLQFTAQQDVTGMASYQRRTQDRRETTFGFTYGIRF